MRTWERNSLAAGKIREEGGGGGAPGAAQGEGHGEAGCHSTAHDDSMTANIHSTSHGGHSRWACPEESKWRAHSEAVSWPMERTRSSLKIVSMERPRNGVVLEEPKPLGRAPPGEVCEGLSPMVELPFWSTGRA